MVSLLELSEILVATLHFENHFNRFFCPSKLNIGHLHLD